MSRRFFFVCWIVVVAVGFAAGFATQQLWTLRQEIEELAGRVALDGGPASTLIFDANDEVVSAVFQEHRLPVRLESVSPHLVNAVLVVEDRRFHEHRGIDWRRVVKAAVENTRAGEIVQGGSTVTQQLVRATLLKTEKSYRRKFIEAVLARRLEERHSKHEILEAYLNRVYFGDGHYGVQAASMGYFGKPASNLEPVEAAMLAALIKGPSLYAPTKAPARARARRDLVLAQMLAEGVLNPNDYEKACAVPIDAIVTTKGASRAADLSYAPGAEYFRDAVTRELVERFGVEATFAGGLRVYTTLDQGLQRAAEEVSRLPRVRAPDGRPLQAALVAIDPATGFVKAMVGGRDFRESPFNRAIDARRQPGSTFKPFIFARALEMGLSPSSRLDNLDVPILTTEGPWLPHDHHDTSTLRLRDALVQSSNRAAAHLLQQVGVYSTLNLVERFGIRSALPAVPSLALGTGEVSLFELTSAYGVFANHGVWREPTTIRRVEDRHGRVLYRAAGVERRVISEATAYQMTSMMADVLNRGTATAARLNGFKLQAAGKTGTSDGYTDAWFVGYTPHLVAGVWFGFDHPRMIMNRGFAGLVAVPPWARFMIAATRHDQNDWFEMPGTLTKVRLCKISGLLATDRCHLPVIEDADPEAAQFDPLVGGASILKEGGTFEDIREIARLPVPCHLDHQDPAVSDEFSIDGLSRPPH
jgi:1A family penicillin-binding protein